VSVPGLAPLGATGSGDARWSASNCPGEPSTPPRRCSVFLGAIPTDQLRRLPFHFVRDRAFCLRAEGCAGCAFASASLIETGPACVSTVT